MAATSPQTPTATRDQPPKRITIIHFNDVYNAQDGAGARFVAAVKRLEAEEAAAGRPPPLRLFSGDALFPSTVSTVTMGRHMVPILNACVDAACLGNHDVDGGVANFAAMPWAFYWLCSNADDVGEGGGGGGGGGPFAGCRRQLVVDHPSGLRVGVIGLVEPEWAATLPCVEEEDVAVRPFVEAARALARELRAPSAPGGPCDLVVALTHMRLPNDRRLALGAGGDVDVVLGGHDHDAAFEPGSGGGGGGGGGAGGGGGVGGGGGGSGGGRTAPVIKSGTDFRNLSRLVLEVAVAAEAGGGAGAGAAGREPQGGARATVAEYALLSVPKDAAEDAEVAAAVHEHTAALEARMSDPLGRTLTDLDARFATVRARESNLGSLVADVFRRALRADAALLNSGTFRSDRVHAAGRLTVGDLCALFPLLDETAVVRATGEQILAALENGVGMWPRLEGRFPQVSGIRFAFDARLPPGGRVLRESVEVAGAPLDPARTYALATKAFVSPEGKDGYGALEGCAAVRDPSSCPVLPVVLRSALHALAAVNAMRPPTAGVRAFATKWREAAAASSAVVAVAGNGNGNGDSDVDGDGNGTGAEEAEAQGAVEPDGQQQQQQREVDLFYARRAMPVSADPLEGGALAIDARCDGRIRIVGEEEALAAAAAAEATAAAAG